MCRLLGIVASEPTEFRVVLHDTASSLCTLSREHPDGWGIAVRDADGWSVEKGTLSAHTDERFKSRALGSRGFVLVSHVRKKTVGDTALTNTHPFHDGPWVFAHNGTIEDRSWLRSSSSPERLARVRGDTDSELLFAALLTRFDAAGVTGGGEHADPVVATFAKEARSRPGLGSANFLLSDGAVTYAHRFGRSLFVLERRPHERPEVRRESKDGTVVEMPWSRRRHAVFLASERMTQEPWHEIDDGTLIRVDRAPHPSWRTLT